MARSSSVTKARSAPVIDRNTQATPNTQHTKSAPRTPKPDRRARSTPPNTPQHVCRMAALSNRRRAAFLKQAQPRHPHRQARAKCARQKSKQGQGAPSHLVQPNARRARPSRIGERGPSRQTHRKQHRNSSQSAPPHDRRERAMARVQDGSPQQPPTSSIPQSSTATPPPH